MRIKVKGSLRIKICHSPFHFFTLAMTSASTPCLGLGLSWFQYKRMNILVLHQLLLHLCYIDVRRFETKYIFADETETEQQRSVFSPSSLQGDAFRSIYWKGITRIITEGYLRTLFHKSINRMENLTPGRQRGWKLAKGARTRKWSFIPKRPFCVGSPENVGRDLLSSIYGSL